MERGEQDAQSVYEGISANIPSAREIIHDEDKHEEKLLNMIDKERLRYISSVVLGLNDALVELTDTLAGIQILSLAFLHQS